MKSLYVLIEQSANHFQLVDRHTTLATIRAHIWKTGGDVVLFYKSNGRKPEIERLIAKKAATSSAAQTSGKVGPSMAP